MVVVQNTENSSEIKQVNFYGLLRTGRHCVWSCFLGFYDLVTSPVGERFEEVQMTPGSFYEKGSLLAYAMNLREKDKEQHRLFINKKEIQYPELPEGQENPTIFMLRDPYAVLYSLYHFSPDGYGLNSDNATEWLEKNSTYFYEYYQKALEAAKQDPSMNLVIRYENLIQNPNILKDVVNLIGIEPKLKPEFVHWCMIAENTIKPGKRAYFKSGLNNKWREDSEWVKSLMEANIPDFSHLGYASVSDLKKSISVTAS